MTKNFKNSHVFDYIIYGSDLNTHMIASFLSQKNQNVLFIERPLSLGPFLNNNSHEKHNLEVENDEPQKNQEAELEPGLNLYPDIPENTELINWFEGLLGETIQGDHFQHPILTFESGQFQTFLGYGDRKFNSISALNPYLHEDQILFKTQKNQWIEKFKTTFKGHTLTQSEITIIEEENGALTSVTINAQKKIKTKKLIFCSDIKDLLHLFDKKGLSKKNKQSLSKPTPFSQLSINFTHKEGFKETLQPKENLHLLMGTKDDFEPLIGRFEGQQSTWSCFFENVQTETFEEVGALLKNMKRQIKRAYPEFFEKIKSEKITVISNSYCYYEPSFKRPYELDQLSNVKVFSPQFYNQHPLISELQAARTAITGLSEELSTVEDLGASIEAQKAPVSTSPKESQSISPEPGV